MVDFRDQLKYQLMNQKISLRNTAKNLNYYQYLLLNILTKIHANLLFQLDTSNHNWVLNRPRTTSQTMLSLPSQQYQRNHSPSM